MLKHLHSANPLPKRVERLLVPLSRALGFHTDYSLENFVLETGLQVAETRRVNLFGYWTLLRMRNDKRTDSRGVGTAAGAEIVRWNLTAPYGQRDR